MMLQPSRYRLLAFVVALLAVRLAFAACIHLTEDEAYYRLWAQTLQLGYYDHPPMIAWWTWIGEHVVGDIALGTRLLPVLATGATTALVYDLALQLAADEDTAWRAAIWYNATLLVGVGGILATPDAPATLFWTATACGLARAMKGDQWRWWLAVGAAAGLACLSKYSALFLAPGAVLWLFWRRGHAGLANPKPWVAGLIAGWVFSVNIAWNARHGWVAFGKQFGRIAPARFSPHYLAEFLAGQAVFVNPLITLFVVLGMVFLWRSRRMLVDQAIAMPVALSAPFAAYLCLHSLHDRVQANWPAPLYPSLAIVAAVGGAAVVGGGLVWARRAAGPFGLALSFGALAYLAAPATDFLGRRDPAAGLRDWPQFSEQVEAMRRDHDAAWVGALSYGTAAQMQADKLIAAPIVQVSERQRYPPGNHSWRADVTQPGLLVDLPRRMALDDLRRCFRVVEPVGEIDRTIGRSGSITYQAVLVAEPRGRLLEDGCWQSKSPADDQRNVNNTSRPVSPPANGA